MKVVYVDFTGISEKILKWGECEFSGLKFTNTSHAFKVKKIFINT